MKNKDKVKDIPVKFSSLVTELNRKSINSREIIVWFRDEDSFDTSTTFWCNKHMADKLGIKRTKSGLVKTKDYYNTFVFDSEGKSMIEDLKRASKSIREDASIKQAKYVVKLKNGESGEIYYIDFILEVFKRYPNGEIKTWGGNGIDISTSYKRSKEIEYLASHDFNTGLYNRRYLFNTIQKLWQFNLRDQTPLSFIMIDVDDFKLYNDSFGHLEGDKVLKIIANEIVSTVKRPFDLVGRYGGEEFMVVLSNTDLDGAYNVAEEIRHRILDLNIKHSSNCSRKNLTISLGVSSVIPNIEFTINDVINLSDKALFQAKNNGKNISVKNFRFEF